MQPLEVVTAFDAELASLGFSQGLEGKLEAAILRRLRESLPLTEYFTGGMLPIETEELKGAAGQVARTLYISQTDTQEGLQPSDWAELTIAFLIVFTMERLPSATGTNGGRRSAIVKEIKRTLRGSDGGVLYDETGNALNEGWMRFGTINAADLVGDLIQTSMTLFLVSDVTASTQEFIE